MKQFVEFVPVALFAGVFFYTRDIYIATAVLMLGVCVQVGYEYGATRRVEKKTQVLFWVAILFGGATLLFHNEAFLLWKPTVVNWLFSAALIASHFMSKENLIQKMLTEQLSLPKHAWRNLNFGWALGFFIAGALNLFVAYTFSLEFWVSYKLFGGIGITIVYMTLTVIYLVKGGYLTDEAIENNTK